MVGDRPVEHHRQAIAGTQLKALLPQRHLDPALEDPDLLITSLASYLVHNRLFTLLLENDKSASFLDFEHNTNLTLRALLRDEQIYVRLVERVVEMNSGDNGEEMVNVLLLDKIGRQEQVLK